MFQRKVSIVTFVFLFIACSNFSIAAVTFSDGTFSPADWNLHVFEIGTGGSITMTQQPTGGNPGDCCRVYLTVGSHFVYSVLAGFYENVNAVYDPGTQGAITSIDYSEDGIMYTGFGNGQTTGPALIQNGKVYYYLNHDSHSGLCANSRTWSRISEVGATEADFVTFCEGFRCVNWDDNPDFSENGSPIRLGFYRYNSWGPYVIDGGIDNWSVTVHSAPPSIPDLELFSIKVVGTPRQGEPIEVDLVIANNGTAAESEIAYGLNPKEEGQTLDAPERLALEPSSRVRKYVTWTPQREGEVTLIGYVREIPGEVDRDNNRKETTVNVLPGDYPAPDINDLRIVQAVEDISDHWVSGKRTIARVYFNDPPKKGSFPVTVRLQVIDRQTGLTYDLGPKLFWWTNHENITLEDQRHLRNTANFFLSEEITGYPETGTYEHVVTASTGIADLWPQPETTRWPKIGSWPIKYEETDSISILAVPISVLDCTGLIPQFYEAPMLTEDDFSMVRHSYPLADNAVQVQPGDLPCCVCIPRLGVVPTPWLSQWWRDTMLKRETSWAIDLYLMNWDYLRLGLYCDYGVGLISYQVPPEEDLGWHPGGWFKGSGRVCVAKAGLPRIVAHEMGHVLGLNLDHEEYELTKNPLGIQIGHHHPIDLWQHPPRELVNAYSFMGRATRAWISPENFDKLFETLRAQGASLSDNLLMAAAQYGMQPGLDVFLAVKSNDEVPLFQVKPIVIDTPTNSIGALYSCTLLDTTGTLLAGMFFEPDFTASDPYPVSLRIPFVEAAHSIQIQKGDLVLFERAIGPAYPTVEVLSPNGGYFEAPDISVQWVSDDADGDPLTHDVYASSDNGLTWFPAALGVVSMDSIPMDTSRAPGGNRWRVKVVATDGFHETEAISATFSIATKPPIVSIESPEPNTVVLEGQEIHFSGSAHDPETGQIDPNALLWGTTGGGSLHIGPSFRVSLPVGENVVYLEAMDSEGKTTRESRTITVKADSDEDGMADDWERAMGLVVGLSEPLDDPDRDGLPNSNEYYYKTDPFQADTDGDGCADGQEVEGGTDPLDPNDLCQAPTE